MPPAPQTQLDPGRLFMLEDPLPPLMELQKTDPVHWSPRYGAWLVTRFEDVKAGLNDSRLSPKRILPDPSKIDPGFVKTFKDYRGYIDLWTVFRDPPDHTRLRRLVNKAFTSNTIEAMRPKIETIVRDLLARMPTSGEIDLVTAFSYPLPAEVVAELIGVPRSMLDDLKRWSEGLASSTSMSGGDHLRQAAEAAVEMFQYLQGIVADRRRNPGNAIIDDLISAQEQEDRLTHDELIANLILFLFAGHETTTSLLSNGVRTLLRNPAQLSDLRAHLSDREVVRNAVEEMLRYDGALYISMRVALQDFEWSGRKIKTGNRIFLYQLSANRDPEIFDRADRFDIRRADAHKHVAFGYGIHFCLGAPLARLEAEIALPALLSHYPKIAFAQPSVSWKNNLVLRGPQSLRLHVA